MHNLVDLELVATELLPVQDVHGFGGLLWLTELDDKVAKQGYKEERLPFRQKLINTFGEGGRVELVCDVADHFGVIRHVLD